jgi:hypothetical protein
LRPPRRQGDSVAVNRQILLEHAYAEVDLDVVLCDPVGEITRRQGRDAPEDREGERAGIGFYEDFDQLALDDVLHDEDTPGDRMKVFHLNGIGFRSSWSVR